MSKVKAARPEGAEAHSPGHRPVVKVSQIPMRPVRAKALIINAFALAIIFADEKKEEKNSFILYTFVKFALVTEQKLNIEEYSISSVNPVPFLA